MIPTPQRFSSWRQLTPFMLAALITVISGFAISVLSVRFGMGLAALLPLPIIYIGWKYGRWFGLAAGVSIAPAVYWSTVWQGADTTLFAFYGFGPGTLGFAALGFLVGYANEQTRISRQALGFAEMTGDLVALVASDLPRAATFIRLIARIERELGGGRCSLLLLDRDQGTLHHCCAPSLPEAYCRAIDGLVIGNAVGSCGTSAYRNEQVIVSDISQDPLWENFRELALEHGLAACWSTPVHNAEGQVIGTFATYHGKPCTPDRQELEIVKRAARDVQIVLARDEGKNYRTQLEEQVQTARTLAGLGELAGGIAHDLNNMMTVVLGNAELVSLELGDSATGKKVAAIARAANAAADLARQLLIYSGRATRITEQLELSSLVANLLEQAPAGLPGNIRLETELAAGLPLVAADKTQLRQIIMNLVNNAAEAIDKQGTGTISVRTSSCDATRRILGATLLGKDLAVGHYVVLEVEDNGAGIPADDTSRVFEPFFSTKFSGRGLGLAVVFGVVKQLKGAIHLRSEPGVGTCVTLLLPAQDQQAEAAGQAVAQRAAGAGSALVIDDDQTVCSLTKEYLKHLGFEPVHEAHGGIEGVAAFRELAASLSLVMVDLTMPDLSGREVLKTIESVPSSAHFILMTGYDAENIREHSVKIMNPILHKPFNLDSLSSAITESRQITGVSFARQP